MSTPGDPEAPVDGHLEGRSAGKAIEQRLNVLGELAVLSRRASRGENKITREG